MLNNLKKPFHLPTAHRWDSMFDSVMGKLDLFTGEELRSELDEYNHPDMEVTDSAVTVRLAMPGYSKEEINVEIENDLLTVRAEHSAECKENCKGKKMLRNERIHAEFIQSIRLPGNIKTAKSSAVCSDGVLTVSIPRENIQAAATRKIEVK